MRAVGFVSTTSSEIHRRSAFWGLRVRNSQRDFEFWNEEEEGRKMD